MQKSVVPATCVRTYEHTIEHSGTHRQEHSSLPHLSPAPYSRLAFRNARHNKKSRRNYFIRYFCKIVHNAVVVVIRQGPENTIRTKISAREQQANVSGCFWIMTTPLLSAV